MAEPVVVTIGGTSAEAVEAITKAAQSLRDLAAIAREVGTAFAPPQEAITRTTSVLSEQTAALQRTVDQMQYMRDAARVLSQEQLNLNRAFLDSAGGTTEFNERLQLLGLQLQKARLEQEQLNNQTHNFSSVHIPLLGGALSAAGDQLSNFAHMALSVTAGMIGFDIFSQAANQVHNFVTSLFELNNMTEKAEGSWQYVIGGGGANGAATATDLMSWTKQASYSIPYTRQDLIGAITSLGATGLDEKGIEHYLPVLADLGARNPNIPLQTVAMAVAHSEFGLTRMLRNDLMIQPEMLTKYGLDYTDGKHIDPTTILPALENYSTAMGYTNLQTQSDGTQKDMGAANTAATTKFWGMWSSFIDRVQNFELDTGGKGFAAIKGDLADINTWYDANVGKIQHLADIFGGALANGLKAAALGAEGFFKGLAGSAVGQNAMDSINNFSAWIADPANQQKIQQFGEDMGVKVGTAFKNTGDAIKTVTTDLDDAKTAWGNLKAQFTPEDASLLAKSMDVVGIVFRGLGQEIANTVSLLADAVKLFNDIKGGDWGQALKDLPTFEKDFTNAMTLGTIQSQVNAAFGGGSSGTGAPMSQPPTGPIPNTEHWVQVAGGGWQLMPNNPPPTGPIPNTEQWAQDGSGNWQLVPNTAASAAGTTQTPYGKFGTGHGFVNDAYTKAGFGVNYAGVGQGDSHDTYTITINGADSTYIQGLIDQANASSGTQTYVQRAQPGAGSVRIGAVGFRVL